MDKTYRQILAQHQRGERPQYRFNQRQFHWLFLSLGQALEQQDWQHMDKLFCLLVAARDTRSSGEIFEGPICKILKREEVPSTVKIFALNASCKYVIQRRNQLSQKLPPYYLQAIRGLLSDKDPELKEWILRTIDEMGGQGKPLVHDILKHRPRFYHMFNRHHRNTHDIIEVLLSKWGLNGVARKKT